MKLTAIQNPEGFHADGADMALLQVEVVDKDGRRCPLDNRTVRFTLKGEAEWRGGIAQGKDNHILDMNFRWNVVSIVHSSVARLKPVRLLLWLRRKDFRRNAYAANCSGEGSGRIERLLASTDSERKVG